MVSSTNRFCVYFFLIVWLCWDCVLHCVSMSNDERLLLVRYNPVDHPTARLLTILNSIQRKFSSSFNYANICGLLMCFRIFYLFKLKTAKCKWIQLQHVLEQNIFNYDNDTVTRKDVAMGDNLHQELESLKQEVVRLTQELDQTSSEKIQSAQYGLVLLEEKENLEARCQVIVS